MNGEEVVVDGKVLLWTVEGLDFGAQTLLIEWQNRDGATPASGCHEVDVVVQ